MADIPAVFLWFLAALPIFSLLFTLLFLNWKARKAALLSLNLAIIISILFFGLTLPGLLIAIGKGLFLSLFVLLIIWSAVLLYNLVEGVGAMKVISSRMASLTENSLLKALLMGWIFSSFIQGIAGFGVPVAIVAPLMVGMGFTPMVAAASTLVGHAWSVTFGSMASSYFTLRLVTSLPGDVLAFWLGILFLLPIFLCGLSVAHIYGGREALLSSLPLVILISLVMGGVHLFVPMIGAVQLATILAGLMGILVMVIYLRIFEKTSIHVEREKLSLPLALFPYILLILLMSFFQIPSIKEVFGSIGLGFSFPGTITRHGYYVEPETSYAAIRLFAHPAPFILFSTIVSFTLYQMKGYLPRGLLKDMGDRTKRQCVPTTISITLMVVMALIMKDSGMTVTLAQGVAMFTGRLYPLFSPFIGVLGSFMTGSNTNSNVLFGAFQKEVAISLGINAFIITSAQSVGGSLGSAIAPAKALLGASTVGMTGEEGVLLRKTLFYCLLNVLLVGIVTLVLTLIIS